MHPGTDAHVLRALMRHRRLTRAELAADLGISKPTAGESVRRLEERGLVADTGERTPGGRGRGRVGSYYALTPGVGVALAVTVAPAGVVAECVDVYGEVVARTVREIGRPDRAAAALAEAASVGAGLPARVAVVGAADPVDRASGRLVQLPDSPFLVGALDPVAIVAPHVAGPVVVDNDVNWAALAERDAGSAGGDFVYLYLGDGLGCAVVADGEIRRGSAGLAGEIAHVLTSGPDGRAVHLIDVFPLLDLRRPGTTAIDSDRLLAETSTHEAVGAAIAGVAAAAVALCDPAEIVIGGPWGPGLIGPIAAAVARTPRPAPVRAAAVTGDPVAAGVRADALRRLRAIVTES